jgi:alkylhydroperoxidase family enzyme
VESESDGKQQFAAVEQGAETREGATAEEGEHAGVANGAPVGAAELAAMAGAQGWHKPILEWRGFARSTAALARRASDLRAIWFEHRLDPAFREEMMVAVAAANTSRQCSFAHREWARGEGLPEAELAALEHQQVESLDARTWAAVAWAQAAARSHFHLAEVPDVIETNFRRRFSPQEQADIELVARTMTWMNRTSNTVDAALARLRGRPVSGSGVLRELAAVSIYALITPFVLVILSVKQRRSPISLIAGIGPFFREFEARQH